MEAEWLSEQLSMVNHYKLWLNKSTAMFLPLPSLTKNSGSEGLSIAPQFLLSTKQVPVYTAGKWQQLTRRSRYGCQLQGPPLSLRGHWGQGQRFAKIEYTLIFLHVRVCYIMTFSNVKRKLGELY